MNKQAKSQAMTIIVIVAVLALVAYATNFNGFADKVGSWGASESQGSAELTDASTKDCPTTGITTYTLNVQDELAATATNVDAEYYIFNGNKLIKEGTTGSDGSVDVDVTCGKDYKVLVVNDSAESGYYGKIIDLQARTSADTVNVELVRYGQALINDIQNPVDLSSNITLVRDETQPFNLLFSANASALGYNKPIIMCQANNSAIEKVTISSFSDGTSVGEATAPTRISSDAGYKYYAFEYPKMLTPEVGALTAKGTIKVLSSTTPSEADNLRCIIVDQATWTTAGYKTASSIEDGFKTGAENTETLNDVGGPDASTVEISYGGGSV